MKIIICLLTFTLLDFYRAPAQQTYVGSTPADLVVRKFLQISLTDSIDFICWKLVLYPDRYVLETRYGLALGGTPGFSNEKTTSSEGAVRKTDNYYYLQHTGNSLLFRELNANLLHFVNQDKQMLVGNGGYSYALNNTAPTETDQVSMASSTMAMRGPIVFEGRTPCQQLSKILALNKSAVCDKLKWYFIFYTDSLTGKPTHYLRGGTGYRKETMERGSWQIIPGKNGRIKYQVNLAGGARPLFLLKGDDNILFFIDENERLLVGNELFSYTLNRRQTEYARIDR